MKPEFINHEFLAMLTREEKKELISLFIRESGIAYDLIRKYFDDRDLEQLEFYTHKLKGATKSLGGLYIASVAGKIERDLQDKNYPPAQHLSELGVRVRQTHQYLRTLV